jgi:hypothetical protein
MWPLSACTGKGHHDTRGGRMPSQTSRPLNRRALVVGLAALPLAVSHPALAQPAPDALSPYVVFVRIAGRWSAGPDRGFTRLILARTAANAETVRLYVQWVKISADGTALSLETSQEVPDVLAQKLRINDYRIDAGQDETAVMLDVVDLNSGAEETWELIIGRPGELRFNRASN